MQKIKRMCYININTVIQNKIVRLGMLPDDAREPLSFSLH